MRILAGFFSLVFLIINPTMYIKVYDQFGKLISCEGKFKDIRPSLFISIEDIITKSGIVDYLYIAAISILITISFLHILLTILHAYGCFTGRPAYIRPMVIDCLISTFVLFIYLCTTIFTAFTIDDDLKGEMIQSAKELQSWQKNNLTIGGIFLVVYIVWDAVTLYTYFDIKQLHEDFMYWIVEERNSQRKGSLRLSTDRSAGSSKSSKASKNSTKSSKMEEHSRPNSAAASIPSKKTSLANNRLSVPL